MVFTAPFSVCSSLQQTLSPTPTLHPLFIFLNIFLTTYTPSPTPFTPPPDTPRSVLANKGEVSRWPLVSARLSDQCLYAYGQRRPPPPQVRPKDRLYYKKLLDRYFGTNHALAQDFDSVSSHSTASANPHSKGSEMSGVNRTWNATASVGGGGGGGGGGDEGGGKVVRVSMQQFPQVRLAYSSHNNNNSSSALQLTRHAHSHELVGFNDADSGTESEVSGLWLRWLQLLQHLALAWLAG